LTLGNEIISSSGDREKITRSKREPAIIGGREAVDDLLSIEQTAKMLHVSPRTLLNYRRKAHGPAPTRIGFRRIFYLRSDVEAYLAAMRDRTIDECIQGAAGIPEADVAARPEITPPRRTRSPAAAPAPMAADQAATRQAARDFQASLNDFARQNAAEEGRSS
jgi:predicted DNA-binding transcriptional regulator AlpA